MGNRALPSTSVWAVVLAMEKAFPVLMGPGVDAVRTMTYSQQLTSESLALLWVKQVDLYTHVQQIETSTYV